MKCVAEETLNVLKNLSKVILLHASEQDHMQLFQV